MFKQLDKNIVDALLQVYYIQLKIELMQVFYHFALLYSYKSQQV